MTGRKKKLQKTKGNKKKKYKISLHLGDKMLSEKKKEKKNHMNEFDFLSHIISLYLHPRYTSEQTWKFFFFGSHAS